MSLQDSSPEVHVGPAAERADLLSAEQLGHLRHLDNLSRLPENDWTFMHGKGAGQDDFGAYRYQLSYMAYALALTHVHRLPNAPGVFKLVFERLIAKLLLPEVWLYWRDSSRGGSVFNAHLAHKYEEQWDPVTRDNIMYSAYVQSIALMYHYLFDDDRYSRPGALSFEFWSPFWGGEPKRFEYDEHSINERVYWQMVESGYLGVACEPNCVFQICNQPAILGFRMHDLITGENVAAEVTESYERAWADLGGRLGANGHYYRMFAEDSKELFPNEPAAASMDAWNGTLMNMWNRDFVRSRYPNQVKNLIAHSPGGTLCARPVPPMELMGRTVDTDTSGLGWLAAWASEMGDAATLEGLLEHADRYMNPSWWKDGLYYPRNDEYTDEAGNPTLVDPLTGNVLLAYGRLNVPDGLWKLYNEPWDAAHFTEPALTVVADDVTVSQARYTPASGVLIFRVQRGRDRTGDGKIVIANVVDREHWTLKEDGILIATSQSDRAISSDSGAHDGQQLQVGYGADGLELQLSAGAPRSFELHVSPTGGWADA